jgi:hypothetical protein
MELDDELLALAAGGKAILYNDPTQVPGNDPYQIFSNATITSTDPHHN